METAVATSDTGTQVAPGDAEAPETGAETTQEGAGATGAAKPNGQGGTVSPAEQTVRKIKYKANGKEVEVDEPELIRRAQKAEGVEKTIRESAELRKQTAEFVKRLKADPFSVLADENVGLGKEMRSKIEQWLVSQLEHDAKDPKDKALEEYRTKAETYEKQVKAYEESIKQARLQQMTEASRAELERQITEALDGSSILPKSERTVGRIAYYLAEGRKRGMALKVAQVIPLVEEDFQNETRALTGSLAPEKLIALLGEETVNKIAEYRVANRKNPSQPAGSPPAPKAKPNGKAAPDFEDFFSRLGR